jgi:DUF971 family protein
MNFHPTQLQLSDPGDLLIRWNDGQWRKYTVSQLRDHCPCATCREKWQAQEGSPTSLPVLSLEETRPLRIEGMKPVGNYAYSIAFSDGHNTGIYTLELLRSLGETSEDPGRG